MSTEENNKLDDIPLNIRIGIDQELFFFDETSPGCCFFLPNGTIIFNKLQNLIREEYFKRGFQEVKTPIILKEQLWEISGHLEKYKENMFCIKNGEDDESNKELFYLSPMNCPKHCLIFKHRVRSYKEIPLRLADFGTLHRNELSNSLRSLFRTKSFHQDDSHIICSRAQIKSEIDNCIDFLMYIYGIFGFKIDVELSTRPNEYIGELSLWNEAEKHLADSLNIHFKNHWTKAEFDGAFYGPKIDIHLTDSLGRKHQCATIQLDFNLPIRFELNYVDENQQYQTPVIIHRAIYGSFERFIGILCEHYNGKWPFWLNPLGIVVIPLNYSLLDYANEILSKLKEHKFYVNMDNSDDTLNKKIRNAQKAQYNYILVIGQKEKDTSTINVRYRDSDNKKIMTLNCLIFELSENIKNFK